MYVQGELESGAPAGLIPSVSPPPTLHLREPTTHVVPKDLTWTQCTAHTPGSDSAGRRGAAMGIRKGRPARCPEFAVPNSCRNPGKGQGNESTMGAAVMAEAAYWGGDTHLNALVLFSHKGGSAPAPST